MIEIQQWATFHLYFIQAILSEIICKGDKSLGYSRCAFVPLLDSSIFQLSFSDQRSKAPLEALLTSFRRGEVRVLLPLERRLR